MSFSYDLYILCDKCGDSLGDSAAFRRKQLPSEKSLADSLKKAGWPLQKSHLTVRLILKSTALD